MKIKFQKGRKKQAHAFELTNRMRRIDYNRIVSQNKNLLSIPLSKKQLGDSSQFTESSEVQSFSEDSKTRSLKISEELKSGQEGKEVKISTDTLVN